MSYFKSSTFFISIVFFATLLSSCSQKIEKIMRSDQTELQDGIYLIQRSGTDANDILPLKGNEKIIIFNEEFVEKTDQDVEYIVVDPEVHAPLLLKVKPKAELQEGRDDGRKKLLLEFNETGKEKLAKFTEKYINQKTTIVVNSEALTMHKIRSVVDQGLLQITRCTDNACEMLDIELSDNIFPNERDQSQ